MTAAAVRVRGSGACADRAQQDLHQQENQGGEHHVMPLVAGYGIC